MGRAARDGSLLRLPRQRSLARVGTLYLSGKVRPDLPAMITPRMGQKPPRGQPWAADTGCFTQPQSYSTGGYLIWLNELAVDDHAERCLFATAPDVVGDAEATLLRSRPVLPYIRDVGYPAALVAQDGLTLDMLPWDEFDALFIGGTTDWKLGPVPRELVVEAKRRGKWTHMGRVNTARRFEYASLQGYDSVDGTLLAFNPSLARRIAGWMEMSENQLLLPI